MMTDEQMQKVAELKAAIAASDPRSGGAPREVRLEVLSLKKELRRAGTTARTLAAALGVHATTLCRWEHDRGVPGPSAAPQSRVHGSASFRVVQVASPERKPAGPASVAEMAPASRSLRVAHAPSGLVIDGLDVETLAALLRRMS
jgi:DNA-binding transcriptional regulator YiaG